jgi:pyrroline-5-carboxylate reductase
MKNNEMQHHSEWEEAIALAAGGDLSPAEQAALDAHLFTCEPCRKFGAEMGVQTVALRDLANDPVETAQLRQRVFAAVRPRRMRPVAWIAAAAAALLLIVFVANRPKKPEVAITQPPPAKSQPIDKPQPAAKSQEAEKPQPQSPVEVAALKPKPLPERPARLRNEKQSRDTVITFVTDDPDVVIYWLVNTEGEVQ